MRRTLASGVLLVAALGCGRFEAASVDAPAAPAASASGVDAGVRGPEAGAPELPRCVDGPVVEEGFESDLLPPPGWAIEGSPGPDLLLATDAPISGARSLRVLLAPGRSATQGTTLVRRFLAQCIDVALTVQVPLDRTPDGLTFFSVVSPSLDQLIAFTATGGSPRRVVLAEQNVPRAEYAGLLDIPLPESGPLELRMRLSATSPEAPARQLSVWAGGVLVGSTQLQHLFVGEAKLALGALYAETRVTGELLLDDVRVR